VVSQRNFTGEDTTPVLSLIGLKKKKMAESVILCCKFPRKFKTVLLEFEISLCAWKKPRLISMLQKSAVEIN